MSSEFSKRQSDDFHWELWNYVPHHTSWSACLSLILSIVWRFLVVLVQFWNVSHFQPTNATYEASLGCCWRCWHHKHRTTSLTSSPYNLFAGLRAKSTSVMSVRVSAVLPSINSGSIAKLVCSLFRSRSSLKCSHIVVRRASRSDAANC